ncbi:hypothetical protein K6Y54_21605 [Burkholderia cenocepacia]|nr:hypothetical protein [Burkholderia cenocepacia]MCW3540493.1 hypothetical protein [Burkholderia cenocepacia]
MPVLMPLAPATTLPTRFPEALASVLHAHGWHAAQINVEIQHMREYEIVKTTNRSVVGMLNEFAFLARAWKEPHRETDLHRLSMKLADVPCKPLRYDSPAQRIHQAIIRNEPPSQ